MYRVNHPVFKYDDYHLDEEVNLYRIWIGDQELRSEVYRIRAFNLDQIIDWVKKELLKEGAEIENYDGGVDDYFMILNICKDCEVRENYEEYGYESEEETCKMCERTEWVEIEKNNQVQPSFKLITGENNFRDLTKAGEDYMLETNGWKILHGDVSYLDYGTTLYKESDDEDIYDFIEVIPMFEYHNDYEYRYSVPLGYIDLDCSITERDMESALNSCGWIKERDGVKYFSNRMWDFKLSKIRELMNQFEDIKRCVLSSLYTYGGYDIEAEAISDFGELCIEEMKQYAEYGRL